MKNFFNKIKDYFYRKRIKKSIIVNYKLVIRRIKRFFKSEHLRKSIKSSYAIRLYICVGIMIIVSIAGFYSFKYYDLFELDDSVILRRLSMPEYNTDVAYLRALDAFGCSNRLNITICTETENNLSPKRVDLDRGGVNLVITFSDGKTVEYPLKNKNFDNFESGAVDNFTLILPYGYAPFDITGLTIGTLPDSKNRYDDWYCRWVNVSFLMNGKRTLFAKESWTGTAVFGSGSDQIKDSNLMITHDDKSSFERVKSLYSIALQLSEKGLTDFKNAQLKADTLASLNMSEATRLYLDIETVSIELQNRMLSDYTKGVTIDETDSLEYDGLMYLDVTFYSMLEDGSYTRSYLLDTLGKDDFELSSSSTFALDMPEGLSVFDISEVSLRVDNPNDAWAPRFIRLYTKLDYAEVLEFSRITDVKLIADYQNCIFYKNLIDTPVSFDLSLGSSVPSTVRDAIKEEHGFSLTGNSAEMYFDILSYYQRQYKFYEQMLNIYSGVVYDDTQDDQVEVPETEQPDDDIGAVDERVESTATQPDEQTEPPETQADEYTATQPEVSAPEQTEPEQNTTQPDIQAEQTEPEQSTTQPDSPAEQTGPIRETGEFVPDEMI